MRRLSAMALAVVAGCAVHTDPGKLLAPTGPSTPARSAPALGPNENIKATEVQRGEDSSLSLVQIRDREQPHVHTRYDLTVMLLSGSGTLWLNGGPMPMRAGDVAFIPKRTPHYFVNEGKAPAAALVVFAPPFTGSDQEPVRQRQP